MRLVAVLLMASIISPTVARAQDWNDPAAVALVSRAVLQRNQIQGDSTLRSWRVRAHGVVLFLAQLGEGGSAPRLVKADELDVEVYWSAPGQSKQVIRGWRDRRYLPTDIRYHRDHLGIVTDGFGPRIRIGEGDEVKDVVHPLSAAGSTHYDFALRDSTQLTAAGRTSILDVIDVRPRDPASPGVVGTLYLDRATAELARARFSFTPVSYLDRTVEALTVLLDYAYVDGRAWLPWKQTIEIRRNAGWLDLPYIGVIRASWEFGDYDLDLAIAPATFTGRAIGGLGAPGDSARPWPRPFDSVVVAAGPVVSEREIAEARREVARAIEGRAAAGIRPTRVRVNSVSDVVHFDRVQGVAIGAEMRVVSAGSRVSVRPNLGIGLADARLTGGIALMYSTRHASPSTLEIFARREIRDLSDHPVISRVLNSLTAQESGDDHGDYVLVETAGLRAGSPMTHGTRITAHVVWEDPGPLDISAHPARGSFRMQPDLGAPGYWKGGLAIGAGNQGEDGWRIGVEGGAGRGEWGRGTLSFQGTVGVGGTALRLQGHAGAMSDEGPAWRSFVLGGRGTLLGEQYRAWGGRRMAWSWLEWRLPVLFPAIGLGDFASTGHEAVVAPFIAAGWTEGQVSGMPWRPSEGVKGSAGVAVELFFRLIRIEAGTSLQTGKVGVTFDVGRAWWSVL